MKVIYRFTFCLLSFSSFLVCVDTDFFFFFKKTTGRLSVIALFDDNYLFLFDLFLFKHFEAPCFWTLLRRSEIKKVFFFKSVF